MSLLKSALFMAPIAVFGVGTILAVQEAVGFSDSIRQTMNVLLLAFMLLADDRLGPSAARRKREGRR
ncbi:MAG TPA: hypothetical protein VFQ14_06640 [Thermoleophilaceae bacterium]|nr:hypothetical protein [Thermoleophilaceae bacterium]